VVKHRHTENDLGQSTDPRQPGSLGTQRIHVGNTSNKGQQGSPEDDQDDGNGPADDGSCLSLLGVHTGVVPDDVLGDDLDTGLDVFTRLVLVENTSKDVGFLLSVESREAKTNQ